MSTRSGVIDVGLRHVSWLRVTVDDGGVTAEAVGVGHRLPATVRIPLSTATRLASEGTPLVVHDRSGAAEVA